MTGLCCVELESLLLVTTTRLGFSIDEDAFVSGEFIFDRLKVSTVDLFAFGLGLSLSLTVP